MDENEGILNESSALPLKERLIMAGIDEIAQNGVAALSFRKVAAACGVSCAAPYRHFKNKEEFISGIVAFIKSRWALLRDGVASLYADADDRLIETSLAYVRFLYANGSYLTVLSQSHEPLAGDEFINSLIAECCARRGLDESATATTGFAVRAVISGAAGMLCGGEITDADAAYELTRSALLLILPK